MSIPVVALRALYKKDAAKFKERFSSPMLLWHDPASPLKGEYVPQATQAMAKYSVPRLKNPIAWEVRKTEEATDGMSVITLGRAVTNDITIDHRAVSRLHAFFMRDPKSKTWRISDSSSRNGTYVNDQRVEPGSWLDVKDRSIIRLGAAQVIFMLPRTFIAELGLTAA